MTVALGAIAAVVAAVYAFLARRDYLRDRKAPFRFFPLVDPSNPSCPTVCIANDRPTAALVVGAAIDLDGDGLRTVALDDLTCDGKRLAYCIPGGATVKLRNFTRAGDAVPVNVKSRLVVHFAGCESAASGGGILREILDDSAAR